MSDMPAFDPAGGSDRALIAGIGRLARFDARGAAVFDGSLRTARQSFRLLLPYGLLQILFAVLSGPAVEQLRDQMELAQAVSQNSNVMTLATMTLLSGMVVWFGFLVAAHALMQATGQTAHFLRLVALHNWSIVPQELLKMLPYLLLAVGVIPLDAFKLLLVGTSLYCLMFQWFIYRQTSSMMGWAAGLVLMRGLIEGLCYLMVAQLVIMFG